MQRIVLVSAALALGFASWWIFASGRSTNEHRGRGSEATAVEENRPALDPASEAPESGQRNPASRARSAVLDAAAATTSKPATSATVHLTVVDAHTDQPLPGLRLEAEAAAVVHEVQSDERGLVELPLDFRRGQLQFQHVVDASHERYDEPWAFERDTLLVDVEDGGVLAATLRALPPTARIRVEVVRASGAPAAGAEVQLAQGTFMDGVVRWHRWRFDEADGAGIAHFYLHHADDLDDSFTVSLRAPFEDEVSDVLAIGPPLDQGPHGLDLYAGSELEVLVVDSNEEVLPGIAVRIGSYTPTRRQAHPQLETDDRGRVRFYPLPAEEVSLTARLPRTHEILARADVSVAPSSAGSTRLVIPAEELVHEVHVAGRVLTADGEPIHNRMLLVSLDGAPPEQTYTGPDGGFEYASAASCERVTVHAMASVYEPDVEPRRVTVDAGTRGLDFREQEVPDEAVVIFEVVDARTGAPVADEDDVAIRVYQQPGESERVTASAAYGPADGATEVEFAQVPGIHWLVTAPGYREQRGAFELPIPAGDPPILRVALERGFRRELTVRDQLTAEALPGVAVLDDEGKRLATSGFDGRLVLEEDEWPEWLTYELAGYESLRWRARSHWFHHSDRIWMLPQAKAAALGD